MMFSILLTFFYRRRRPENITGAVAGNLRFHHKKTLWSKTISGFELGFDYLGSICPFRLFLGRHFPFLRVA